MLCRSTLVLLRALSRVVSSTTSPCVLPASLRGASDRLTCSFFSHYPFLNSITVLKRFSMSNMRLSDKDSFFFTISYFDPVKNDSVSLVFIFLIPRLRSRALNFSYLIYLASTPVSYGELDKTLKIFWDILSAIENSRRCIARTFSV